MYTMRRSRPISVIVLASSSLASCTARHDSGQRSGPQDVPAWRTRVLQDRADKDRSFATSPTSPLAGIERFTPTAAAHVAIDGDAVRMTDSATPGALVSFEPLDAQRWTWHGATPELAATTEDGKTRLAPGEITQPVLFRLSERFHLLARYAANTFVVTAFDRRRKEVTAFTHLAYFEPDPRFVVTARLARFDTQPRVELATSRGLKTPYVRYGQLRFAIDGKPSSLTAFHMPGSPEGALFIPFRDATSGKASYGAARFLEAELARASADEVTLDFNAAYNPLCAYSPAWNCPLPPPENQLAVAITAGERTFGDAVH